MFRAALSRNRQVWVAATSATALTGSAAIIMSYKHEKEKNYFENLIKNNVFDSAPTQCSSISQSITNNNFTIEENSNENSFTASPSPPSLVIPSLEAANRARRLVKTILLMIFDYEKAKFEKSAFMESLESFMLILQTAFPILFHSSDLEGIENRNSDDTGGSQKFWSKEIEKRKKLLDKAQMEYTSETSEHDVDIWAKENGIVDDSSRGKKYKEQKRKEVQEAANFLGEAEEIFANLGDGRNPVHMAAARKLLRLCRENGGVYIKIGQHLANLDYLIPAEYIHVLSELFDDAPVSSYSDVCEVIKEELGGYPDELFESFSEEPIASASLAQVHVAIEKGTGRKLAVKVQHRGVKETSAGDLKALEAAVLAIDGMFQEFTYRWIVDEIAPNLPVELDFSNEGKNAEIAHDHIKTTGLDCSIPEVLWDKTNKRVLCMTFEEGFKCTDLQKMEQLGLDKRDVAQLISSIFNAQIFQFGFVHCDPHPANVLLREHPTKKGKPEIVLVDHGLYKKIDDDFRITYAELWKSLMIADLNGIKTACEKLGIGDMHPLFAAMLTSRPFDEIIERSKLGSMEYKVNVNNTGDKAMIQGYAQRYIKEIFSILDKVPRQMLLLLKMNDCLRHVDFALGSPSNTLVVAGYYASTALFHNSVNTRTIDNRLKNWIDYWRVRIRINLYMIFASLF